MTKRLIKYSVLFVFLAAGIFILLKVKWLPSIAHLFASEKVVVDQTPILVKEINNLAQLVTVTAYNEVVIDSVKKGRQLVDNNLPAVILPIPRIQLADNKIILIGKGKILAGVDLQKLKNQDLQVTGDSVFMRLPAVEILQVITNPSDFETFDEIGFWSNEDIIAVKSSLREKLISSAIEQDILRRAAVKAKLLMENFLRETGFRKITVVNG